MNRERCKAIAILGTGSDVGKSIVCTALCRILSDIGYRVSPYKAQNMSNNSFVTIEGGEIGRAQVAQAEAARIEPHVDMNPVLLKPSSDTGSQVVLHGRAVGNRNSKEYWNNTKYFFEKARESLNRLKNKFDVLVMEGAGSCAEVNLRHSDIVNFRMAHEAQADVFLLADIDKGGVFAQIIGTLELISPEDRGLIKGIIINKFRGDPDLFDDGIAYIEEKTGLPVLGLIPFYHDIYVDSEDAVTLYTDLNPEKVLNDNRIKIAVIKLPHISNFTDFAVFQRDTSVNFEYLYDQKKLSEYDMVILPGTKNVRFDIEWLRDKGWEKEIVDYASSGGRICGICGGFQMLGTTISDPDGVEGTPGETAGLNLLNVKTTLAKEKVLKRVSGVFINSGEEFKGYEIHMGVTSRDENLNPVVKILSENGEETCHDDGATSDSGRIWGCYVHGLFDSDNLRNSILKQLKPDAEIGCAGDGFEKDFERFKNENYDRLAGHFRKHLNISLLWNITGINAG